MPSTKKGPADEAPKLERQRAETRDEKNLIHYIKIRRWSRNSISVQVCAVDGEQKPTRPIHRSLITQQRSVSQNIPIPISNKQLDLYLIESTPLTS